MTYEKVNLRNVLLAVLAASLTACCLCAPVVNEEVVYDQRQNGSENFRVHIKGIVIVHAPMEALVALASISNDSALQEHLLEVLGGSLSSTETSNGTNVIEIVTESETASSETTSASTATSLVSVADSSTAASTEEKPVQEESNKPPKKTKPRFRLANILMPLIRRL